MAKHPFKERPAINQKIYMLRKELGLTQPEVAKLMGMKYDTYAKKECNGNITFDFVFKWAKTLNVDPVRFSEVFDIELDPENPYETQPEPGKTFILKSPNNGIIDIYDKQQAKSKEKNKLNFELTDDDFCVVKTFHFATKSEQTEIKNFINKLQKRGR